MINPIYRVYSLLIDHLEEIWRKEPHPQKPPERVQQIKETYRVWFNSNIINKQKPFYRRKQIIEDTYSINNLGNNIDLISSTIESKKVIKEKKTIDVII